VGEGRPLPASLAAEVDALFAANQGRVFHACRRIVRNEEQARDLAQETLLVAYRKLGSFRGESAFSTWLHGIARGLCFNAVRRRSETLSEDGLVEVDDPTLPVLSRMRKAERSAVFQRVMQGLTAEEQEAVHLRYVEGLPQDTITEVLGLSSASGARGLLQRCRRHLEKGLRAELGALGHGSSFFRTRS